MKQKEAKSGGAKEIVAPPLPAQNLPWFVRDFLIYIGNYN